MRNAFIEEMISIANDERVIILLADNGIIVFDEFRKRHPDKLLNLGIAESNLIGMAAGISLCGKIPFVYSIIPFLIMRPFEFIRDDVCYQNTNVKLVGIGAGFAYSTLGPTHHGTEDISIMRCLPGMTIISPADPIETRKATRAAFIHNGPVYLRIGTGKNPVVTSINDNFSIGLGQILLEGSDLAIISHGTILHELIKVCEILAKRGVRCRLINMSTIKPLDYNLINETFSNFDYVFSIEEHVIAGGLGSAIAEYISEMPTKVKLFKRIGIVDTFVKSYGTLNELRKKYGLTAEMLSKTILEAISNH